MIRTACNLLIINSLHLLPYLCSAYSYDRNLLFHQLCTRRGESFFCASEEWWRTKLSLSRQKLARLYRAGVGGIRNLSHLSPVLEETKYVKQCRVKYTTPPCASSEEVSNVFPSRPRPKAKFTGSWHLSSVSANWKFTIYKNRRKLRKKKKRRFKFIAYWYKIQF